MSYIGNEDLILFTSAARAGANNGDVFEHKGRGLLLIANITARSASDTLTISLQARDPVSGEYLTIWQAASAINSADLTVIYSFMPGQAADAANLYTDKVNMALPRQLRPVAVVSGSGTVTFSLAAVDLV